MDIDDIDETTGTSAPDEIQPSSTETLSLKETEKRSSELLVVVPNESIEPVVSRDAVNSIRLVEADKCHFMKNENKLRVKRNNIWSNQRSWRKNGATNSYANRDLIIYSDGEYYFLNAYYIILYFTIDITTRSFKN